MIIVFTTFPSKKSALKIINILLDKHLIACANLFSIQSFYWWKRKKEKTKEYMVFLKTRPSFFNKIKEEIIKNHPYSVPEIVAFKTVKVNSSYKKWLYRETFQ